MHQQTNIGNPGKLDPRDISLFDAPYRGYVMNESFRNWLNSCPADYMFYMKEVTADSGTYTFILK